MSGMGMAPDLVDDPNDYDAASVVLWEIALEAFEGKHANPATTDGGDLWNYLHSAVGMAKALRAEVQRLEANRQQIILARDAYRAELDEERQRRIEYQELLDDLIDGLDTEESLPEVPHSFRPSRTMTSPVGTVPDFYFPCSECGQGFRSHRTLSLLDWPEPEVSS